jgi:hypothetical protein
MAIATDEEGIDGARGFSGGSISFFLAVAALGWYCTLWALSILGCMSG